MAGRFRRYSKRGYKRRYKRSKYNYKKLWSSIRSINKKLDAEPKKLDTVKSLLSTDTGDDADFAW